MKTTAVVTMHVLLCEGVRDQIRVKPAPFVFDTNVDTMVTNVDVEKYFLLVIELITVLGRIYNDLIDEQFGTMRLVGFSVEVLRRKRMRLADQLIKS